jgi:hypothetical protein
VLNSQSQKTGTIEIHLFIKQPNLKKERTARYLSILTRTICIAHFPRKLKLLISRSKIELSLELSKKKIWKTSRHWKVCNQINIYQMKLWSNSCQRKELALDQKRDYFMNKNLVLKTKKIFWMNIWEICMREKLQNSFKKFKILIKKKKLLNQIWKLWKSKCRKTTRKKQRKYKKWLTILIWWKRKDSKQF